MPDAAGQSLEEPDVRARAGEFDMTETLASHFRQRDFDSAFVADHSAMFHAFVFPAEALPVRYRSEDPGAEQAVLLGFECPIIDGFRLGDFAVRPRADFFRRGQADTDAVK